MRPPRITTALAVYYDRYETSVYYDRYVTDGTVIAAAWQSDDKQRPTSAGSVKSRV